VWYTRRQANFIITIISFLPLYSQNPFIFYFLSIRRPQFQVFLLNDKTTQIATPKLQPPYQPQCLLLLLLLCFFFNPTACASPLNCNQTRGELHRNHGHLLGGSATPPPPPPPPPPTHALMPLVSFFTVSYF
jgi:hypothetical protein